MIFSHEFSSRFWLAKLYHPDMQKDKDVDTNVSLTCMRTSNGPWSNQLCPYALKLCCITISCVRLSFILLCVMLCSKILSFVSQDLLDFKDVNEAFSCLSDPTKRAQYDIQIAPAPSNEAPIIHEVTNIVMQPPTKQDAKVTAIHF